MSDALKKMTPSEVGRLGALARQGKYKAKKKELKGRKKASPEEAAAAREAKRRQEATDNRATVMAEFGSFGRQTLPDLEAMASGKEIAPEAADGMVMAGLAEKLSTGQVVLSAQGKKLYNAASRGDVGAAKDAIDRAEASAGERMAKDKAKGEKDKAKAAEKEKPKAGGGGGGGGGKDKPKPEEKDKAAARAKTAQDTAAQLPPATRIKPREVDALRRATTGDDVDEAEVDGLIEMGFVQPKPGGGFEASDQGRAAHTALERGNRSQYEAAIQNARGRLEREGAAQQRTKDAGERAQARQAEKERRDAERQTRRKRMDRTAALRVLGETNKALDAAIKQTAQDRAMFANMGGGGSGGGGGGSAGGGGKPSGGTGGLWAVNPETGKREPGQGLAKGAPPAKPGTARAEKPRAAAPKADAKPATAAPVAPLRAPVSGDLAAEARFREQKLTQQQQRAQQKLATAQQKRQRLSELQAEVAAGGVPLARLKEIRKELAKLRAMKATDMDDETTILAEIDDLFDTPLTDAIDALSDAAALLEPDDAIKAGRRNAAADQALLDAAYDQACALCDLLEALGATQDEDEPSVEIDTVAPMKALPPAEVVEFDDVVTAMGDAVKAIGDGWVGGYLVKFSDPTKSAGDLTHYRDMFLPRPDTDYGSAVKSDVYVHHRQLPGLGRKQLRNQAEIGFDDAGVFIKHLLDMRDDYERKLYGLAQQGKLGWSSGTAPHLMERKALDDGRHVITRWPLGLDASYTPTPAGGLDMTAAAFKALLAEIGLDAIDSPQATDPDPVETAQASAVKTAADDRARRLRLRHTLLSIKETA